MKALSHNRARQINLKTLFALLVISVLVLGQTVNAQTNYRISTGDDFGAVIDAEGNLFLWGAITDGSGGMQRVDGNWREVSVSRTASTEAHILLIANDGTLWSFGSNARGQLGIGDQEDRSDPVQISSASDWVEVAAGAQHSIARENSGAVYAWGDNSYGQLNVAPVYNNPAQDIRTSVPSAPIDSNSYTSIAAGNAHSHAIRDDTTLWAWGSGGSETNGGPELGILVDGSYPIGPVELTQVGTGAGWTDLFGGYRATFALKNTQAEAGQLWVWGSGGNLGFNDSLVETPRRVGTGTDWAYVSQSTSLGDGNAHALALKADGTLYGWGSNYPDGQLGLPLFDGAGKLISENTRKVFPTLLESPATFLAIASGDGFSAIIDTSGFLLTAGRNDAGQLANGFIDSTLDTGQDFFDTSQFGEADLEALSVTVNEQAIDIAAGNTISVSFEIQNIGTGTVATDFDLEARLNTAPSFGGVELDFNGGLSSIEVKDDFAPDQARSIDVEIELPTNIPQGSYYLVLRADSADVVTENSESNNDAATDTTFNFLPDLVVPSSGLTVTSAPSGGTYDPGSGDTIDVELLIENAGNGTLPAGSTFDVRFFLSPERSTTNSGIVELEAEEPVVLAVDLEAGDTIPTALSFSYETPFMPADPYFVGVQLDINEAVAEQPELLDDNNVVVQPDGEANNAAFTASQIAIAGLTLAEAVDQDGTLTFTTEGDGDWFGQAFFSNDGVDAAQSPNLGAGETASFSTSFSAPVAISFDWSANTSSQENQLSFRVVNGTTGGNNNTIFGNTSGWVENISRVIPENALAEWAYTQGVEGQGDTVYVDNLQFTEITEPDLVIDDIYLSDDAAGTYVLQRDRLDLTLNSRNQGSSTAPGEEYVISVYLSPDPTFDRPDGDPLTPDDILIRQQVVTDGIASGDSAVNGFSINLDLAIEPGPYYVIGYIDDYTDASGALLPGKTSGSGEIAEFTGLVGTDPFPGEENNVFVSDAALVEIVALPDIKVAGLAVTPNYYFINDPATNYSEPNNLPFDFTLENLGLGSINDAFEVQALLSRDQALDSEEDYTFLEYIYDGGLGASGSGANERTISPDNADFRQNIVSEGFIGERLFFGVLADSTDAVTELFEDNNSFYQFNNDLILSEFTLQDALDVSDSKVSDLDITFTNDQQAPYDSKNIPWVGQSTTSFDASHAATNVKVGNNETSKFSVNLEPTVPVRVSFWWKVSSEDDPESGQRDVLAFLVDGTEETPAIFGTEEDEWRRVEVVLDAGPHTLTWAYVKDGQGSDGADRGWVDQLTVTELPNLQVSAVSVDGSVSYQAGDTINTWSVDIVNAGEAIEPGAAFDVQVRLLPDADWAETAAVTLLTITDDTGIGEGESRSYSNSTINAYTTSPGTADSLTLPAADYDLEYYYLGAYVDWSAADPSSGRISESNETEVDNSKFTEEASIQIGRPDLFGDASSINFFDMPYDFGDSVDIDLTLSNIGDGVLSSGSNFDYQVYLARTDEENDLSSSSSVLLGAGSVAVSSDVASGDSLSPVMFSAPLPYGLANGDYFIGVVVDTDNDVSEQGLAPDGTGTNGEANNVFFSSSAILEVSGISLYEALNDGTSNIAFEDGDAVALTPGVPFISQNPDSGALWFGRDNSGNTGVDDNFMFTDGDGAQAPELQQGEFAEFSLTVPTSSLVRFDWRVFSGSDQNVLSVLVDDVEIASISGDVAMAEIDPAVLVPDDGTVTWRYTKGAATSDDFAYIDDLRIEDNNEPDLVLTSLNYTAGEYILDVEGIAGAPDQLLGTEYLDITVEATNQGESVTSTNFTTADMEVRLSTDRVYGNGNDIVLGTVSQVEGDLLSGNLIRFIGPIKLGDSIPEDNYYLIAKIDSNEEVTEFSESNNIVISENRDVVVTHLPALRIYNPDASLVDEGSDGETNHLDPREGGAIAFDVDEAQFYNTESPMRLRFSVQNIGLGRIEAGESWTIKIDLVGALREDLADAQFPDPDADAFFDAFDLSVNLGDFTVQELMEGRSEERPEGKVLDFDVELALPSGARFAALLPEDRVISEYLWCIEVDLDANDDIAQSAIVRESPARVIPSGLPWRILDPFEGLLSDISQINTDADEGAFGINVQPEIVSEADWEALYGITADETGTPSEVSNFLAYAFNRNPTDTDTAGGQFPGSYGVVEEQGAEFFSVTFDFVTRASDLEYTIEADSDVNFPNPDVLLTITPPFTESVGSASLTGDGGLIEEANVLNVLDQGYSARITVRDNTDVAGSPTRFIRVVVDSVETTEVP